MADQVIYDIQFGQSDYYDYNSPAVTLEEAKAQLIIDFDYDDALLSRLILAATQAVATYCNISINNQMITVFGKADSRGMFRLPYIPVRYVSSIVGRAPSDISFTSCQWAGMNNIAFVPPYSEFTITYFTGYNNPIPADLKQGILAQVAYLYENRGDQDKISGVCNEAAALIKKYVDPWI